MEGFLGRDENERSHFGSVESFTIVYSCVQWLDKLADTYDLRRWRTKWRNFTFCRQNIYLNSWSALGAPNKLSRIVRSHNALSGLLFLMVFAVLDILSSHFAILPGSILKPAISRWRSAIPDGPYSECTVLISMTFFRFVFLRVSLHLLSQLVNELFFCWGIARKRRDCQKYILSCVCESALSW